MGRGIGGRGGRLYLDLFILNFDVLNLNQVSVRVSTPLTVLRHVASSSPTLSPSSV